MLPWRSAFLVPLIPKRGKQKDFLCRVAFLLGSDSFRNKAAFRIRRTTKPRPSDLKFGQSGAHQSHLRRFLFRARLPVPNNPSGKVGSQVRAAGQVRFPRMADCRQRFKMNRLQLAASNQQGGQFHPIRPRSFPQVFRRRRWLRKARFTTRSVGGAFPSDLLKSVIPGAAVVSFRSFHFVPPPEKVPAPFHGAKTP